MLTSIRTKQIVSLLCALSTLALIQLGTSVAQDIPTSQPKLLLITREQLKVGRDGAHSRSEAAWVKALEKANSAWYYLALSSLTGADEVWYISHFDSHTALGEAMKHDEKDNLVSAENARYAHDDSEFVTSVRNIEAAARPELSSGTFPDLSKARFYVITTFTIRPGHESQFEEASKAYLAANKRAGSKTGFRTYQVTAGLPGSVFLVFSSVEDYGQFDQSVADDMATWKAATHDEMSLLEKCMKEGIISVEDNRFRIDPTISYVTKATREKDPAFWMPK
jgi:hypothetical protein